MIKTEDNILLTKLLCKVIGHKFPQYEQFKVSGVCDCLRCGYHLMSFITSHEVIETVETVEIVEVKTPPAYTRRAQSFTGGIR